MRRYQGEFFSDDKKIQLQGPPLPIYASDHTWFCFFLEWLRVNIGEPNPHSVTSGVEVPGQFLDAIRRRITSLLKASRAGDSTAGEDLSEVLATLAKIWSNNPIVDVPEGQDGITVVHDYEKQLQTRYKINRNRAYTVGRKNCGNGIELVRSNCDDSGASVLTAILIPAPDKQMWVLVPTKNTEVKVRHLQKELVVMKRRVICFPWGINGCYVDLSPWFGLVINTHTT